MATPHPVLDEDFRQEIILLVTELKKQNSDRYTSFHQGRYHGFLFVQPTNVTMGVEDGQGEVEIRVFPDRVEVPFNNGDMLNKLADALAAFLKRPQLALVG